MKELQINDLSLDPLELSKEWLIVTMFFQTTSINYKEAVSIAGGASFFRQIIVEGKQVNLVGFDKTKKDISKFMTLHPLIASWKSARLFAGGRPLSNTYYAHETIRCYLKSLSCRNYEAYCWQIVEHPSYKDNRPFTGFVITLKDPTAFQPPPPPPPPLFLRPCRRLDCSRLSKYHPATLIDQLQAIAVDENVDWCPNFKPDEAKTIER